MNASGRLVAKRKTAASSNAWGPYPNENFPSDGWIQLDCYHMLVFEQLDPGFWNAAQIFPSRPPEHHRLTDAQLTQLILKANKFVRAHLPPTDLSDADRPRTRRTLKTKDNLLMTTSYQDFEGTVQVVDNGDATVYSVKIYRENKPKLPFLDAILPGQLYGNPNSNTTLRPRRGRLLNHHAYQIRPHQ